MAETTLEWKLESKNFDEFKSEMIEEGDDYTKIYVENTIGDNHCKACVLASGPMCIKRSVCRIPENEIWINKEITEIKEPAPHIIEYADVCNFMMTFVRELGFNGTKFPTEEVLKGAARKEFEGREFRTTEIEDEIDDAYTETKKELEEFYVD